MTSEGERGRPTHTSGNGKAGRQFVKFSFFKLDRSFYRLSDEKQRDAKLAFLSTIRGFNRRMVLRSYSLVGLRPEVDFMLWQVAATPEPFQALAAEINRSPLAPYLTLPHAFLAITRRSMYDIGEMVEGADEVEERITISPGEHDYLFVYPFVKTRPWYALPFAERQEMINEHIRIGRKYPQIKLNTTYSYGIDDQEFVVAFEGDNPSDFVDLVMELRESEASMYTLRDTPMFTCRNLPLPEVLDTLGGPTIAGEVLASDADADGWVEALPLADLPATSSTRVYLDGQQIALFNAEGTLYAINNRCPHARGPLSEGTVECEDGGCRVTCPWHEATFDLATGDVVSGVAQTGVAAYDVAVENGVIKLRKAVAEGNPA